MDWVAMSSCPRHVVHAPICPSPASPTNTFPVLVAATRAGPELRNPGTPPTNTVVPVAGAVGLTRKTPLGAEAATTRCEGDWVGALPPQAALCRRTFGGCRPGQFKLSGL